jgi:hypothetical protein
MFLVPGISVFPQAGNNEKIRYFAEYGYGIELLRTDRDDFQEYIINHGAPLKMEAFDVTSEEDAGFAIYYTDFLLYYENRIVKYRRTYDRAYREVSSALSQIISLEKGEYVYGIHIGMTKEDFCRALDIIDSGENYLSYHFNVNLEIYFENQVLSKLVWRGFEKDVFFVEPWIPWHEIYNYYGIINTDNVELYLEPSTVSEVLTYMKKGEQAGVRARNGVKVRMATGDFYWFKIEYQDFVGWAYGEYLDFFNTNEDGILERNKEALSNGPWNISVEDSEDNKFIGFVDCRTLNDDALFGDVFVYQKYIVLQEYFLPGIGWLTNGFTVFEYDENIDYCDYRIFGKQVLKTGEADSFLGIRDGFLFVGSGTGHGVREFDVWNLAEEERIFSGASYKGIKYCDGVVERIYHYPLGDTGGFENKIKTYAEEFIKNNAPPTDADGLYTQLIITADYNLYTGKEKFTGAKYILDLFKIPVAY